MKTIAFAALALIGASIVGTPSFGQVLTSNSDRQTIDAASLVLVANKKTRVKQNWSSTSGYIPGYVLTPYGRADCIGRWWRDKYGRFHCQGQLIPYLH